MAEEWIAKRAFEEQSPAAATRDAPLLDRGQSEAMLTSFVVTLSSGRRYEIQAGPDADRLVIRGRRGEVIFDIEVSDTVALGIRARSEPAPAEGREARSVTRSSVAPLSSGEPTLVHREAISPPPRTSRPPQDDPTAIRLPRIEPLPSIPRRPTDPFLPDPLAIARSSSRPAAPDGTPTLTLEQYAAICAESAVSATTLDQALSRYGITDRSLWQAIDRDWKDRLARDPTLTLRWMDLTSRYREAIRRA